MTNDPSLLTLDPEELTLVSGGKTHFYPTKADADHMAVQLEKWNPKSIYDTVQAKNGQYYVTGGRPRPADHRNTYSD